MASPNVAGAPRARGGFPVAMTLFMLAAMALLIGLGVWQLKRLHWKQGLLAQIAAAQAAAPTPLGPLLEKAKAGQVIDYRRVVADCPAVETAPFIQLFAVNDAGAGYRIITACRLSGAPYGSILVDRGFVAQDDAQKLKPGVGRTLLQPIVGILRRGDARNFVTPQNQPSQDLWYWRDIPAMAASLHAPDPAPTFLMLQTPAPEGFGPTPAPVPANIPNNHLQYAGTWFGLAAALAGVYLAVLWRRRSD
jgi:surfeit locus 1 family protein